MVSNRANWIAEKGAFSRTKRMRGGFPELVLRSVYGFGAFYEKRIDKKYQLTYNLVIDGSVGKGEMMCASKRMSPEQREKEICEAAASLFREKGFQNTTMEDVVSATSLSKGGVYHYYSSTIEILHDLMVMGIDYRNQIIVSYLSDCEEPQDADFLARRILEKILDDNPFMGIYVQFLLAKHEDPVLYRLFDNLKRQSREQFSLMQDLFPNELLYTERFDFLTDFINSMIIGANTLGARENFQRYEDLILEMIKTAIGGDEL